LQPETVVTEAACLFFQRKQQSGGDTLTAGFRHDIHPFQFANPRREGTHRAAANRQAALPGDEKGRAGQGRESLRVKAAAAFV